MTGVVVTQSTAWAVPRVVPSLEPVPSAPEDDADRAHLSPILCCAELNAETRARLSAVTPRNSVDAICSPRAALDLHGLTMGSLCRQHMERPAMATRGAILVQDSRDQGRCTCDARSCLRA
jgi:hypothetical protein